MSARDLRRCELRLPFECHLCTPWSGGVRRTNAPQRVVGAWTIALAGVDRRDAVAASRGLTNLSLPLREYHALQNARIELRFDLDQRKVIGQVTHTVAALHEGYAAARLRFGGASIFRASRQRPRRRPLLHRRFQTARRSRTPQHERVKRYEVAIRYEGKPKKGIYFVWPDKSNAIPTSPKRSGTQGEAQDTLTLHSPIYDYPNNRATIEMIVTVPQDWVTVSNGKLEGIADAGSGMKTWTWKQAEPISSYLISLVAGEFDEVKESWHNLPVDYYVPHGERDRVAPTFAHTRDMLTFFSDRVGVPYPWAKYDQTMVDQFVEGGMENVSATTLTTRQVLLHPLLARESLERSDNLISHEMSHQWFGDLVTCKDWANLWLNEGFATFMWPRCHGKSTNMARTMPAYSRWRAQAAWLRQKARLYAVPVVTRDFNDSMKYAGNIYGKAGLILEMLREQLGDETFFHGLQHYLEVNRLGKVVTADLIKALEESSHPNLDRIFEEWIYGGGAPRFSVTSTYDAEAKLVRVQVKQSQEIRATVGLFEVPVTINVTTARGAKDFPVTISKADETFSFPAESQPLMVLFDKGDKILKTVDFQKSPAEWIYQLQHASEVPDRAEAAKALGNEKGNEAAAAALGEAALHDPFWGVRDESLLALGRIGSGDAEKSVIAAAGELGTLGSRASGHATGPLPRRQHAGFAPGADFP